ncbi:hypothetical protein EV426DRAFT_608034, partial [Tirmania nivea]
MYHISRNITIAKFVILTYQYSYQSLIQDHSRSKRSTCYIGSAKRIWVLQWNALYEAAPEEPTIGHAGPPSQSNTVTGANNTPVTASGSINIAAASNSSIPPGRDPAPSNGESLASAAIPTHAHTGPCCGDGIVRMVHCSLRPQETVPGGKPDDSAILPSRKPEDLATASSGELEDSVATSIAPVNLLSQTPVSNPASDSQTSSIVSQAMGDPNYNSDMKTGPTVAPSSSAYVWQKTLEIVQESLTKHKLPSPEIGSFQSQSAAENIQSLHAELKAAHQENKNRQWRYKDRQGNEVFWVERLGEILKSVDKYTKIVDSAIQHHPNVTSLVWAGARTILQVALNHVEAMEYFEGAMVTIMDKMAVSTFYAGIYEGVCFHTVMGDAGKLYEVMGLALPEFYAAVIVFAIKARQYFEARWVKMAINMLKPFAIEFQPFIDDISRTEKTIKECADMATMERNRRSSVKIVGMENLLTGIQNNMNLLLQNK